MAVEPAGAARQRVAGSASACSAATEGRPGRTRAPAGRATDHADIAQVRERMPRSRTEGRSLAGAATVASDRQERASGAPARRSARPRSAGAIPAVAHLGEHFPRARPRRCTWRFAIAPLSFRNYMVARGGGVAVQLGVGRLAAARGRRPTRGRWRPPGRPARRSRTFAWQLDRAKVGVLSPAWKPATQEWGRFRTVNWTPNPENRPQCERNAAARRAQNPPISRQMEEWRGPESNRGHHDFQGCCVRLAELEKPLQNRQLQPSR
jgi:hypothetical protein